MNPVPPQKGLPFIDYFDQDIVTLFNCAWLYVRENWNKMPLDAKLLLDPYANGVFGPLSVDSPVTKMAPYADWVIYQWFNRTGDRPGLVQMMYLVQEERLAKKLPLDAMAHISRYVFECNNAGYEGAFAHKALYYTAKKREQCFWSERAGTFIGGAGDAAKFLLAEVATPAQADTLYQLYLGKNARPITSSRDFFYICKGFEKFGMINEVRTAVLSRLYSIIDSDIQDPYDALIAIVLMIENVIGIHISEWRRQMDWLIVEVEKQGLHNVMVRKGFASFMLDAHDDNWMLNVHCEKEYMITVNSAKYGRKTYRTLFGKYAVPL